MHGFKWPFAVVVASSLGLALSGCGDKTVSYSLQSEVEDFELKGQVVNEKMDILWVIDNSGSMRSSQDNLASNLNSFMQRFSTKGYDFKVAVTTTNAYQAEYLSNPLYSKFRDGTDETGHSGVFVITPSTPNLLNVFMTNVVQGILGSGDERGFQSMRHSLNNSLNAGFLRSDSYLSVIFLTDEEDFSHPSSSFTENPALADPVSTYVSYLDQLTDSSGAQRRYSVSAIAIFDEACRVALNNADPKRFTGRKIASRHADFVDATEGIKGSLCGDFAAHLEAISAQIVKLSTQLFLSRKPVVDSIRLFVDEVELAKDPVAGWQYNEEKNSIVFGEQATPEQGQKVRVAYEPTTIVY